MPYLPRNAITNNVYSDCKAVLEPQGIQVYKYNENVQNGIQYEGEAVVLVRVEMRETALQAGQQPAGFYWIDVTFELQSYTTEDLERYLQSSGEEKVRDSFERDMFQSYMDNYSSTTSYYTWQQGTSTQDQEDNINILSMSYTWLIRPSVETT